MAFAEDMSVFFDTAVFAVPASFTPSGGSPLPASVLFDAPTVDVLSGQALSEDYKITLPVDVWPTAKRDDVVTVDGDTYTVRAVHLLDDGSLKQLALTKGTV